MRSLIAAAAMLVAFAAPGSQHREPTRLGDAARSACEARGGRIAIAGLSGDEMCAEPLADAGRACTGSDQCRGFCELDESSLTLKDLELIKRSFIRQLQGVYHPRIEYPEPQELDAVQPLVSNVAEPS